MLAPTGFVDKSILIFLGLFLGLLVKKLFDMWARGFWNDDTNTFQRWKKDQSAREYGKNIRTEHTSDHASAHGRGDERRAQPGVRSL
jgi:hypothetical protein